MPSPVLLLVDDIPEMGVIVTALGRRGGCAVVCRPDVPSAWAWLQEGRPDLVLLDKNLPGADGLELCRRLRTTPGLAALPVALFCHWGMPADVADGLEAGIDFVFAKDLVAQPDQWQRRLADILTATHGRAAAHSVGCSHADWASPRLLTLRPADDWIVRLRQALHHGSLRPLGTAAIRILLRRALAHAFGPQAAAAEVDRWLSPNGAGLDPGPLPSHPAPAAVVRLAAALRHQVWCLLGTEACAPFRAALDLVVPGLSETWAF